MRNPKLNRTKESSRRPRLEKMEDRLVMSADPVGAISIDYLVEAEVEADVSTQATSLSAAHALTGQNAVTNAYGFDGSGQTVAVIDSGIAWDHYALGGGFGAGYKVVGGWDFAENDWNPYDDGSMGSHGTHVSGIIGAENGSNSGVATGADIVSLRVFDDNGNGYFSWVEQALQWVHDHKDSFANPITTVNLSLGAEWNSNSVPYWAELEDEFAQLEADGIFISVAAGNSFTNYNSPGLSYPAASSYVVPVSAVDGNGNMAYFSQRNSRVIAAPGVSITSTVPDYVGNFNGQTDDWASYSGTSMAAPYLAGASMLIRQAMQTAGWSNITQDAIYDVMRDSADWIYDSVTSSSYARLNLEAAVTSIMGADDYGSTVATAENLGSLSSSRNISGAIGTMTDVDYFRFTATSSGKVTINGNFTGMQPTWILNGGGGTVSNGGKTFTFNVQNGQSYTFGVAGNQTGSYSLNISPASLGFDWTEAGSISQKTLSGLNHASGNTWYSFTASRTGTMTVEALFAQAGGNVDLQLYDADLNLLASSSSITDGERIDIQAMAGQAFFLKSSGANSDVTLRFTNLVSQTGNNVTVCGTSAADDIDLIAGFSNFGLTINGVSYSFANSGNLTFNINAGGGVDTVSVYGGSVNESGSIGAGTLDLAGSGTYSYTTSVRNAENIELYSGGGIDSINMAGTTGDDVFKGYSDKATMEGAGYSNYVSGYRQVNAQAGGGYDEAYLLGSAGNDTLVSSPTTATLYGSGFSNSAAGFDKLAVYGCGGYDRAQMYGSSGNDTFIGREGCVTLLTGGAKQYALEFDRVDVFGGAGFDTATFYGSDGDDTYYANPGDCYIYGDGYYNRAVDFESVIAHGGGGVDYSYFKDGSGNDTFIATPTYGQMYGPGFTHTSYGFYSYQGFSRRGNDVARLYDSDGNDMMYTKSNFMMLYGSGFKLYAKTFNQAYGYASEGFDKSYYFGTSGNERLYSRHNSSQFHGDGMNYYAFNFDRLKARSYGGSDIAYMYDSPRNDTFTTTENYSVISGGGVINYAHDFKTVYAYSSGGTDKARFYDSKTNDTLSIAAAVATLQNTDYYVSARGFDKVYAYSMAGGDDDLNKSSTDFYFATYGAW